MSNPLLVFWQQMFGRDERARERMHWHTGLSSQAQASATIFLIMRRMRTPLIVLIVIFSVSVIGFTLVPGIDEHGHRVNMSFFDSFYVMSYTATTIGYGEIPRAFSSAQRMWVIGSIYLTVVGWAYAIGALLTLLQDTTFRRALRLRSFTRRVTSMRQPFLLMVGYGHTGEWLGRALDQLGMQLVVLDRSADRIDALELAGMRSDVPSLVADASDPANLGIAGLDHPFCTAVLALTDSDEANLAVTMSAALLRPDIPVIARTVSPTMGTRMAAFGTPSVVNPFDRFGDHLRLALRAPSSYQLLSWLEAGPGSERPPSGRLPRSGRWILCGYGRFGQELTADLQGEALQVTIIEPTASAPPGDDHDFIAGDGSDPSVLTKADLATAVGLVAGTDNDTANLSILATARRLNPSLYLAGRQNLPANAPLYAAMHLDALLVPTEVTAREVYAQLSTPLLWRFLQQMPSMGEEWAGALIEKMSGTCGRHLEALWRVVLDDPGAPALRGRFGGTGITVGQLLTSVDDRTHQLDIIVLLVQRGDDAVLVPAPEYRLAVGDQLLLAGRPGSRRLLEATLTDVATAEFVLQGRHVPSSWVWRRITRRPLSETA